jgi:hypothetical protein
VPTFEEIKSRHRALMAAYERALRTAANLGFVGGHGFGFIARFLTETHVRAQLQRLIAAYAVIEQRLGPDRKDADWFRTAREQLERSSGALRNLGGSFAAATPWAAIVAFISITSSLGVWASWRWPVTIVALAVATGVGVHAVHRRGKRRIFAQAVRSDASVETLETKLFENLPVRERRDLPNTMWGLLAATCLVAAGTILWEAAGDCTAGVVAGVALTVGGALLAVYYAVARPLWLRRR